MDIEQYGREYFQGKSGAQLQKLAQSADGQKVAQMLDMQRLQSAAQSGDRAALGDMLQRVLSTPEGRRLAEQVQKAVKKDG